MRKHPLATLALLLLLTVSAPAALAAGYAAPSPEVRAGHGFLGLESILIGGTSDSAWYYGGEFGLTDRLALLAQTNQDVDYISLGARYLLNPSFSLGGRYTTDKNGGEPGVTFSLLGGKEIARNLYAYATAEMTNDRDLPDGLGLYWEVGGKYQLIKRLDVFGRVGQNWIRQVSYSRPVKVFGAQYEFVPGFSGGIGWSESNTYLYATKTF